MTTPRPLPLPPVFEPKNAEKWEYAPDQQKLFGDAAEWRKTHGITPAATDKQNIHLLLIDVQKDFCFPKGSLYVGGRSGRGALDDSRRTAEFVYRNIERAHEHHDDDGHPLRVPDLLPVVLGRPGRQPLAPFREITTDDIDRRRRAAEPCCGRLALQRKLCVAAASRRATTARSSRRPGNIASTSGRPTASSAATDTGWSACCTRRGMFHSTPGACSRGSRSRAATR